MKLTDYITIRVTDIKSGVCYTKCRDVQSEPRKNIEGKEVDCPSKS